MGWNDEEVDGVISLETLGGGGDAPDTNATDLRNGERFAEQHRELARFAPKWKKWLIWDGRRWRIDDDGEHMRLARQTAKNILTEAGELGDKEAKALGKWAVKSMGWKNLRAMVELAATEEGMPIDVSLLDTNPMLLNVENGTIDLSTGKLRPHDQGDLITKLAPVAFDPKAPAKRFEEFISEVMGGDEELVSFLQRAVGYSLTGDTRERVIFVLHGVGRNGKSTLLDLLRELLSDFGSKTPVTTLLSRKESGIPNDIARLKGARLVYASENDESQRLNEALIKELTGRETLTARFLRCEFFEFLPEFKLWLATNHRPEIRGTDAAIWDRVLLVPFNVRFKKKTDEQAEGAPDVKAEEQDLPQRLRAELPGVLRWAVEGCLKWQRDGLAPPGPVRIATDEYRVAMDVLAGFLEEKCIVTPMAKVGATVLHKAYVEWAKTSLEPPMTQRAFGQRMVERGYQRSRETGGRKQYQGVGLRQPEAGSEGSERLEPTAGSRP